MALDVLHPAGVVAAKESHAQIVVKLVEIGFELGIGEPVNDDRGKTLGRLVEEKEPRAGAQDAADGEHLLLAAGKLCALARQAFLEIGKELENATEFEPAGPHLEWQQKIFLDVEARKNSAFLWTQRNAEPRDAVAGQTDELSALIAHRPG